MSQRTIAAARQKEMKTSIAVVTTMICGCGRRGTALGSGVATSRQLGGGPNALGVLVRGAVAGFNRPCEPNENRFGKTWNDSKRQ